MEVEIKAKCQNFADVKKKLEKIGALLTGTKHQLDQYYNHPVKDIRGTKEYIRLRKSKGKSVFAYHVNISKEATKEYEVEVNDFEKQQEILELCGFKKLGLIDKTRLQYQLDAFKICLDEVPGIGNFVEIETFGDEDDYKEKYAQCIVLLEKLGLSKEDLCDTWLCDVATKKE